jgi:cytochrome c biogenesis factor
MKTIKTIFGIALVIVWITMACLLIFLKDIRQLGIDTSQISFETADTLAMIIFLVFLLLPVGAAELLKQAKEYRKRPHQPTDSTLRK